MTKTIDSSIARRYGESWTAEDGGRWRPGTETCALALRAAGYHQPRPRVWVQTNTKALPAELIVTSVEPQWPHATVVEISVL